MERNFTQLVEDFNNHQLDSIDMPIRNLVVSCLTIYAFKKICSFLRQYYLKYYAKILIKYFEDQLKNTELTNIKKYLIQNKIEKIRSMSLLPIHILEIGFCGSNFNFYPDYSILTMCNCCPEMEPFIRESFKNYEKKLWLSHRNLAITLNQIKSDSIDVIVCSHYLCCVDSEFNKLIDEIYRVLKPVSFNDLILFNF